MATKYQLVVIIITLLIVITGIGSTVSLDKDRVSVFAEISGSTEPLDPDTDNDGLLDGTEIQGSTNPLNSDSDNDRLSDFLELER